MPVGFLAWPDDGGETPVTCCPASAPCVFHQQFGVAIRSPLRTQANTIAAPPGPTTLVASSPEVPPPEPAEPPAPS